MQEQFYQVIQGVTGLRGRVYANVAPDSPVAPYAVYSRVTNTPENTLSSGVVAEHLRYQVDVYSSSYLEALGIAKNISQALDLSLSSCLRLLERDFYEPEVKLHRVMQDFAVWET